MPNHVTKQSDHIDLLSFISLEYLQQLQDRISATVGLSLVALDSRARPITRPSNPRSMCRPMHENGERLDGCDMLTAQLMQEVRHTRKPAIRTCPHTGLLTAQAPLLYKEHYLGSWATGQVSLLDTAKSRAQSASHASVGVVEQEISMWESELLFALDILTAVTREVIAVAAERPGSMDHSEQLEFADGHAGSAMAAQRAFMNTADVMLYVSDYQTGEIITTNESYAKLLGSTAEEVVGQRCFSFVNNQRFCSFCPREKLLDEHGNPASAVTWENQLESSGRWLQCTSRASRWVDGRLVHVVTCIDITERKKLENEVNRLAFEDRLLEIPNSVSLERDIAHPERYDSIVVVDIEGLRKINDVYGRSCGDQLLMAVRDYLLGLKIDGGTLYRLNVADFALLLPKCDNPDFAKETAQRIFDRCKDAWPISFDTALPELYMNVNVCVVPVTSDGDGGPVQSLYSAIEHTMENARKIGGVAIYNDLIERRVYSRMKLELSLKNAVGNQMEGFYLVYQPIIDPGLATWHGIEVLCRWESPELGLVPPLEFISVAESSGQIRTIGYWVLETALSQVKKWGLDKLDDFLLEVNLSPVQLSIQNLAERVTELLQRYDYPPQKLCLEVTESNEMNFSGHSLEAIEHLHEIGVVIALDDFGTGYSSFQSLHKLPVEILKTDRSFINGVEQDPFLQQLFRVMVELAHASDMLIVAEGVETEFQAEFLSRQGADFFQGYLFSRPLTAEQMSGRLENFYKLSSGIVSFGYSQLDIANLGDVDGYALSPELNSLLVRCLQQMHRCESSEQAIDEVLRHAGEHLHVSRAYVYFLQADGSMRIQNEWSLPDIPREKNRETKIDLIRFAPEWLERLCKDGLLVLSDTRLLAGSLRSVAEMWSVSALVQFPLYRDGELVGLVGFSECGKTRHWSGEEVQLMHTLAGIIATELERLGHRARGEQRAQSLENLMEQMDANLYVSDVDSGEILYASPYLKKRAGFDPTGQTCWQALRNRRERCDYCPVPGLLKNPDKALEQEYFSTKTARHFRFRGKLSDWEGRAAYMQYTEDISELRQYQGRLELYSATDPLTELPGRTVFFNSTRDMLDAAWLVDSVVSIVYVSIDQLERIYHTYGAATRDELISCVALALGASVRENDLIGRYGEGEFSLALMRCTRPYAEQRMRDARARLNSYARFQHGGYNFRFGVAESLEIEADAGPDSVENLLALARLRVKEDVESTA